MRTYGEAPCRRDFSPLINHAITLACALIAVFCFGSRCQKGADSPPGYYEDKEKGFSIQFGENWEIRVNTLGLDAIGLAQIDAIDDKYRENVSIASSPLPKPMTCDEVMEANMPNLKTMVTDFKELEKGHVQIGGQKAAYLVYDHRIGIFDLETVIYALPGPRYAYLINATYERTQAFKYRKPLEEISQSFRVLP